MEKLNELSNGEKAIGVGGVLMVIASFLPWYKVSIDAGAFSASFSRNGWQSPGALWSVLAVLIAVAMVGVIGGMKFGNLKLPDLGNFSLGQIMLGAGGLTVVLIVLKFLGESSSLSIGFFLGVIAAVLLAAGGYLLFTEEKAAGVSRA